MFANNRTRRKWNQVLLFLVSCHFVKYSISSPIFSSQFSQFQSARNLRNLPCVAKKSGLKGVCMFAIDCIKSNGTHLGTCIDKFYFGSCCQTKNVESIYNIDLDDNRIDSSFPASNSVNDKPYVRPVSTTSLSPATVQHISSNYRTTSSKPAINYNNKTFELIPTTTTTKKKATTQSSGKRPITSTTEKYSVHVGGFTTTLGNIVERNTSTTINLKDEPSTSSSTTESIKLTTFQSIQQSIKSNASTYLPSTTATTLKPLSTMSQKLKPTSDSGSKKPVSTTTNRTSVSSETILTTMKPSRRPIAPKPSKNATATVIKTTRKPVTQSTLATTVNRRPTVPARRNSTRKPLPLTSSAIFASTKPAMLTTISFVQTTKVPRPRPKPTSSIIKVDISTLPTDDEFTTTFSVMSAEDKESHRPTTATINTSTVKVTRRPTKRPASSSTIASTINKRPVTELPPLSSSSFATTKSPLITQKPLNTTTQKIVEADEAVTASPGLVTWTLGLGNDVTDNTTAKDKEWILLTSVTPTESKTSSIIDTISLENKITPSTTSHSLITENLTQSFGIINTTLPVTEASTESIKVDQVTTTEEASSEEDNIIQVLSSTEGTSEEDSSEEEGDQTTTVENFSVESTEDFSTISQETDDSQITTSAPPTTLSHLSPNETLPAIVPDESDVNPVTEYSNVTQDTTTYSSSADDKVPATTITVNETTTSSVPSSTMPNLEGVDYKQICGRRMFPEARIVGGSKSSFGRWPWQISLRQWRTSTYLHKCGSALLNENWAISAAHCVDNVPPSDLLLRLGEYDLSIEEEPYGFQERRVQIVASHPQFDPRTFEYDLALLRFYEPVVFQPNIIPVCVPETDEDFIGRSAHVTGWGRLYEDGPLPSVLQEVSVPVIKNDICESMYRSAGYIEHIPHIFICAGWQKGGRDSCEDSGGPMVIQRQDKRFQLAGIISWGIGCALPNQPGVYTRISEFRDWINQILMF